MKTLTKEMQAALTPSMAVELLKEGNKRFINNLKVNRNLLQQVNETCEGQHPFAIVLSCIDSRTSAELIFDQGLGDIFSARIAGNVLNEDILGSMEFACKVAGSKVVVVLGHTRCGAIKGACDDVKLGNLSTLLQKIRPAIDAETTVSINRNASNSEFVERVAELNVHLTMERVLAESPVLKEMVDNNEIAVVGGLYNVESGEVEFFVDDLTAILSGNNNRASIVAS